MGDARTQLMLRKPGTGRAAPIRARRPAVEQQRLHLHRIQPALRVGAANDPMEHEAEAMSERVATMSASSAAPPTAISEDPSDTGSPARREDIPQIDQNSQPDTDQFESAPSVPADHQDPDVPNSEDVDTAGLEHDEFGEIETGEPVPSGGDEEAMLSPADTPAVGAEGGAAPADVARRVAQPGTGRPLPASVRSFMEPRFGVGFEDVRIHDTPDDRRASERIGARAFTHRQHIWLGEGESVEDRRLLAHELTHVVQQTKRPAAGGGGADTQPARRDCQPAIRRGWIANKAEKVARNVPGYFLLTVILGKSPITGDRVERNATNLIGGFLGLLPGGNLLFEKLQETRALERAYEWVSGRLSELDITWSRVKGLVSDFIDEMPSWSPIKVAKRIFRPLVEDIVTFVGEIKDKILEFILKGALMLAGSWGEKIWGVIEQARDTLSLILNDPLGFAKNLVGAIVGGFRRFSGNIWKHLKAGLMGWLFGTLQGMNIELPEKLDFKGILSVALQIVGLTYANFRAILVKRLGRNGERKVAFLEKSVEVVKILLKEGFVGIWQRVVEAIEGFKTTVIDGIRDWVIQSLVMGAVSWLAGLSNPIGAIIKVALAIYNMIKAFLERLEQIMALASSIFSSMAAIARGQVEQAAEFIEKTIARTIPVVLAFVAALIPVTGITKTIQNIIKRLQAPVKKAMDKLVTFFVKKAKKLFSKLLGKVNRKRELKRHGFVIGKEPHKLIPEKKGKVFALKIASEKPRDADQAQQVMATEAARAASYGDDSKCVDAFEEAFRLEIDQAQAALGKVQHDQQKTSTKKQGDKAEEETADAGKKLSKLGPCIADNPFLDAEPPDGAIIRAREPRVPEIEGNAGLYKDRGVETARMIDVVAGKAQLSAEGKRRLSLYYENDHIPEKSLGAVVQEYVQGELRKDIEEGTRDGTPLPEPHVGEIEARKLGAKGEYLPAITIYRPLHRQKTGDTRRDHKAIIAAARAGATPRDKIARLRAGVQKEMATELEAITGLYGADQAATKDIRAKVNAGMRDLGGLNKVLFGFEPGKAPEVSGGREGPAAGSDLPMEGSTAAGVPDFADLEGTRVPYNAKPDNVGNYLEYDHVVEATLAEKAKALELSAEAFRGALDEPLKAAVAEQAAKEQAADGDKARDAAVIEERARGRLRSLVGPAFKGPIADYKRETAGTVALYRPVHREVTSRQQGVRGDLLSPEQLTEARTRLIAYAVSNPSDTALRREAVGILQQKIRTRFEEEIASHTALIRDQYQVELREFMTLNKSQQAAAKMGAVIERVAGSLRDLRGESINLLK